MRGNPARNPSDNKSQVNGMGRKQGEAARRPQGPAGRAGHLAPGPGPLAEGQGPPPGPQPALQRGQAGRRQGGQPEPGGAMVPLGNPPWLKPTCQPPQAAPTATASALPATARPQPDAAWAVLLRTRRNGAGPQAAGEAAGARNGRCPLLAVAGLAPLAVAAGAAGARRESLPEPHGRGG